MKKNNKSYPYMTYDNKAKAIYLGIKEGKYFQSKTVREDYYTIKGHMINIDYDKDDNVLGIEILLPENRDKKLVKTVIQTIAQNPIIYDRLSEI